jgi:uncharacterized protein with HEPN domain
VKEETVYLRHILECVRRIEENTSEGRDRFMASHTLQDAVLRNLHLKKAILAMLEATKNANGEN